jgi:HEAT repeat protein
VLERLVELSRDEDPAVRYAAAVVLHGSAGEPGVLERLVELSRDEDPGVRQAAAEALRGSAGEPGVLERLVELSRDEDPAVRYAAETAPLDLDVMRLRIFEFAESGRGGQLSFGLNELIRSSLSWVFRSRVVSFLAALYEHDENVVPLLREGLLDDDNDVRASCVRHLALIGRTDDLRESQISTLLIETFGEPRFEVRDRHEERTASDYGYDGLAALASRDAADANDGDLSWRQAMISYKEYLTWTPRV